MSVRVAFNSQLPLSFCDKDGRRLAYAYGAVSGLHISLVVSRISTHPCILGAIESNSQFLLGSLSVEEELFIKERL